VTVEGVGSILVVDASPTARETLRTVLIPHCRRVLTAASAADAVAAIDRDETIGLVLCDAVLPEQGGYAVLRHARGLTGRKPEVIVVSPWWIPADSQRATDEGALGYLVRPISLRDVARLWKQGRVQPDGLHPRMERRPLAKVWLLDPLERGRTVLSWDLYDVSTTGAFIETRGPLPVGAELQLEIIFGKESVRCAARVVRVQEPCWMHVGGVGVVFTEVEPTSRRVLEDFVHQSVVVAD
jgi:twitching motility two-component system response regulator PilH